MRIRRTIISQTNNKVGKIIINKIKNCLLQKWSIIETYSTSNNTECLCTARLENKWVHWPGEKNCYNLIILNSWK